MISIIGLSSCTQKPEDPDDNKGPIRTEFQLKSMSFNMKFENMSGGGDPIHTWAIRKNGIAEALKNYDVDIVGSQELQCWQHDELMGILGDAWASVGLPRFQKIRNDALFFIIPKLFNTWRGKPFGYLKPLR